MSLALRDKIIRLLQLKDCKEVWYNYFFNRQKSILRPFCEKLDYDFRYELVPRRKGQKRYKKPIEFGNCVNKLHTVDKEAYMDVLTKARKFFDEYFNFSVDYEKYGKELIFD